MVSKGVVAGVVVLAVAGAGAAYAYTQIQKQAATTITSLTIRASTGSPAIGETVSVTGTASDVAGNPVGNATVYVFVNGQNMGNATTGSDGTYALSVTFNNPGSYEVWTSNLSSGD